MDLTDLSRWARSDGLEIVLLALGGLLLGRFVHWSANRFAERVTSTSAAAGEAAIDDEVERDRHRVTIAQAIERTVVGLIAFVVAFMALVRLNVPITTLVAPATIAGVALGFGAQRIVADLLTGFFLVSENQYGVGDVVELGQIGSSSSVSGTVEALTLRTTRLRSFKGELVVLPNSDIRLVTNKSRDWSQVNVDIPVTIDADVDRAIEVLRGVAESLKDDADWDAALLEPPTVMGIESIDVGYVSIRILARTLPTLSADVAREIRRRGTLALRAADVAMPRERVL